jgi:hypothetical protein
MQLYTSQKLKSMAEQLNISNEADRPVKVAYPDPAGLRRIRFISRLLDQSILLPGGYRIGLDPIIGLVPGIGDLVATALSCYPIIEAYRLGIPVRIILQMLINVAAEGLVGTLPVLGDVFDAVWKANMRNLRLVEASYSPRLKERSVGKLVAFILLGMLVYMIVIGMLITFIVRLLLSLF